MALLQSSDNHIFYDYLGSDIVNLDQLFVRTQGTISSRLEASKLSSCFQKSLPCASHHPFPTNNGKKRKQGDFPSI